MGRNNDQNINYQETEKNVSSHDSEIFIQENSQAKDEKSSSDEVLSPNEYREKIIEALKQVIDPEIHINVVDIGLIYKVEVSENLKYIDIEFTLTTPGCPLADEIEQNIKEACLTVLPHVEVKSVLVWTPMWNADFMSEDARLELGFPI